MKKFFTLNKNGFIESTTDLQFPQDGQDVFDFPNDFDFLRQGNYRIVDGKLIDDTEKQANLANIAERSRPLTESEVSRMLITQQINTLTVDDNTALRMRSFYPEWTPNTEYSAGFKVQYNGNLWRVLQAHTSQDGWEPENVPAMWEQINEAHTGELADPVPYNGNMALENGKYYIQDNEIYLCTRDTVNPVYNSLAELVGLYVEEI